MAKKMGKNGVGKKDSNNNTSINEYQWQGLYPFS